MYLLILQELKDRFAFRKKSAKRGDRSAVCQVCQDKGDGQWYFTELSLRRHLMKVHGHLPCKDCLHLFADGAVLAAHSCPLQNIPCDLCAGSPRFANLDGWKVHRAAKHRQEGTFRKVCHLCGAVTLPHKLPMHMEVHHGILPPQRGDRGGPGVPAPPFDPCPQCGKRLKNRPALRDHLRRIHSDSQQDLLCRCCGRTFRYRYSLSRHMASAHPHEHEQNKGRDKEEEEDVNEELAERENHQQDSAL